jgi:hypothetical protein
MRYEISENGLRVYEDGEVFPCVLMDEYQMWVTLGTEGKWEYRLFLDTRHPHPVSVRRYRKLR